MSIKMSRTGVPTSSRGRRFTEGPTSTRGRRLRGVRTEGPTSTRGNEELVLQQQVYNDFETKHRLNIRSAMSGDYRTLLARNSSKIRSLIIRKLNEIGGLKVRLSADAEFVKFTDDTEQVVYDRANVMRHSDMPKVIMREGQIGRALDEMIEELEDSIENTPLKESNYRLVGINFIEVSIIKYNPLRGSSYINLPDWVKSKRACINIQNEGDDKCFLWCLLCHFFPPSSHPERVRKYWEYENEIKMDGIRYPVIVDDIDKIEDMNNIRINVFFIKEGKKEAESEDSIRPLRISDYINTDRKRMIDLLLLTDEETGNSHYVYIKNFDRLMGSQVSKHGHRMFFCRRCLVGKSRKSLLYEHEAECIENAPQKLILRAPGTKIKFEKVQKRTEGAVIIYADFESLVKKEDIDVGDKTKLIQEHECCSYSFYTVCRVDDRLSKGPFLFRGENAAAHFLNALRKEKVRIFGGYVNGKWVDGIYKKKVKMIYSEEDEENFKVSTHCYLCEEMFTDTCVKVRDHCHITGKYRGAAHNKCNLEAKMPYFIPVVFHNLKNYDSHHILMALDEDHDEGINAICNSEEKYLSFTIGRFRFIDSMQFLNSSLDNLVKNLKEAGADKFYHTRKYFIENSGIEYSDEEQKKIMDLILRKGVYPYEYMDSWERFEETEIIDKEKFYSTLYGKGISDEDYEHYIKVWETCGMKNLGNYHDFYQVTDVLLLADVFENFREQTLNDFGLDPFWYYGAPGLAWDAMLRFTRVKLDMLWEGQDDMLMFIEKGIRGGISMISHRYAKANNELLPDYDETKPKSYIIDLDENALYTFAMSMTLPSGEFAWEDPEVFDVDTIMELGDDDEYGYLLEVDLEYPKELHDLHSDYPVCAEKKKIPASWISPYNRMLREQNGEKVKDSNVVKLVPNLYDKEKYVIHYRTLKQVLSLGLKLKKVWRVLGFRQSKWLEPYINFCTEKRMAAKNKFEKDYYKLMANIVYGKTMENVRKRMRFELSRSEFKAIKLASKPEYISCKKFNEVLCGHHLRKIEVVMDKPIYVGCCVLELSKMVMYEFHYNYIKEKYGDKAKLIKTDTDSLEYFIECEDLYKDMFDDRDRFDLSDFPKDERNYNDKTNMKVPGKMKDESEGIPIMEVAALKAKTYSNRMWDGNKIKDKKRGKGFTHTVTNDIIQHEGYVDCVLGGAIIQADMHSIRSYDHRLHTIRLTKSTYGYDDKRWVMDDGISTLAHGHYKIAV